MDLLNTVKSAMGGDPGDKSNELIQMVPNLIGGQSGGLNGLISQFSSKGLGDVLVHG